MLGGGCWRRKPRPEDAFRTSANEQKGRRRPCRGGFVPHPLVRLL